jgi:hypothetical protein
MIPSCSVTADRCRRVARDSTDPVLQVSLRAGLAADYQMKADELENDEIILAKRADLGD